VSGAAPALDDLQERIRLAPGQLIAARIKRARRTAGPGGEAISHDALGQRIGGVTRQHLIKLEKAQHRPRADMLTKIAAATNREIDWFLDPEVDPSPFPEDEKAGEDGDGRPRAARATPRSGPRSRAPAGRLKWGSAA
jgi:transcriptional regulator with XRE-family HTH domain